MGGIGLRKIEVAVAMRLFSFHPLSGRFGRVELLNVPKRVGSKIPQSGRPLLRTVFLTLALVPQPVHVLAGDGQAPVLPFAKE